MKTQILQFCDESLTLCSKEILKGGLVAFPTETVYGLGANAFLPESAKKIYEVKGRPSDNPLIVHISQMSDFDKVAAVFPRVARKLAERFMPGALTLILPKVKSLPYEVTGGLDTVGVRMPSHQVARELIKACGVPLCAPSANTSTFPSPTRAKHVLHDLDGKIKYILDGGECEIGIESTIIDVCGAPKLLRRGGIPIEEIEDVVGKVEIADNGKTALCPGMKYKHYSPNAQVYLALFSKTQKETIENLYDELSITNKTVIIGNGDYGDRTTMFAGGSVESFAHKLFDLFRQADECGYANIVLEGVEESGLGASLFNRMIKASGGKTV